MYNSGTKKPVYFCSYQKSGRTWFRFILANYFNNLHGFEQRIDYNNMFALLPNVGQDPLRGLPAYKYMLDSRLPLIVFDHSGYHDTFDDFDIVFMVRNVHDTLVSNYFQLTNRHGSLECDIKSYIHNPDFGLMELVNYLNAWSENLSRIQHCVLSYEEMHSKTMSCVSGVIKFLVQNCDEEALLNAVEKSSFNKMKDIEIKYGFPNPNLKFKSNDNNALRAREGKVGNYVQYLDKSDINYINNVCDDRLSKAAKKLLASSIY